MAERKQSDDAQPSAAAQDKDRGGDTALKMLRFLLEQGEGDLKIITAERSDVPEGELVPRGGNNNPLADPRAYVLHDVVRLEGPDHNGDYIAYSEEGDHTHGRPGPLLAKLTEHSR